LQPVPSKERNVSNGYNWLKFAHVVAVIFWLGGASALTTVSALLVGSDRGAYKNFIREAGFYGPVVIGPASLVTLLTGLVMAGMTGLFRMPWVQVGFAGIVFHFVFGPVLIRRAQLQVDRLLALPTTDEALLRSATRRVVWLSLIYQLVMLAVVGVMIFKPAG
jgi:uncharacterized membrane protein